MHEAGVAQVVEAVGAEDLGTSLEPHRLAELRSSGPAQPQQRSGKYQLHAAQCQCFVGAAQHLKMLMLWMPSMPGGTHRHARVLGEQLWGDAAEGAEHGPAGVDDLDLPVAGEGLWVSGQTSCVPACRQNNHDVGSCF